MTKGGKKYHKDLPYSYCIGVFPSIELLKNKPQEVLEVTLSSDGEKNEGVEKIKKMASISGVKVSFNNRMVEEISGKQNAYVVTTFKKFDDSVSVSEPHLVLVNPSDAGNLGTIMRTALAFDVENIVIIKPAVDEFDPKVVRASMGAIFQMKISTFNSFTNYSEKFPRSFYTLSPDGETEIEKVKFGREVAIVFGAEGGGVPTDLKDMGNTVRIVQSDKVDSLNLPVSVGIALHYFKNTH